LKGITDYRERDKQEYLLILFWGIASFVLTIAAGLFSIVGVTSEMLGYHMGYYQQQNYDAGKAALFVSSTFLVIGFFFIGTAFLIRALYVLKGITDPLAKDIIAMKPVNTVMADKRKYLEKRTIWLFALFYIVAFIVEILNPDGNWVNALIILAIMSLIFIFFNYLGKRENKKPPKPEDGSK